MLNACANSSIQRAGIRALRQESWFLARCFSEAARRGIRGVVSFADPVPRVVEGRVVFPGHVGTIYQAANAVFTGRSSAHVLVLLPNGAVLNRRSMQKVRRREVGHDYVERLLVGAGAPPPRARQDPKRWLDEALASVGAARVAHRGCYRYAFRLGLNRAERARVAIALDAASYPKSLDAAA